MTTEISPRKIIKPKQKDKSKRIYIIDEIRGTAVIAMVVYHFLFSAGYVFRYVTAWNIFKSIRFIEPIIAVTFVFLSGVCTKLSRSNLKRGAVLFAIALAVNVVTEIFVPSIAIRFGVINLLSVCMILYGVFEDILKKVNPILGMLLSFAAFMLTWGLNYRYIGLFAYKLFDIPDILYQTDFLFPLGFRNETFRSGDYFPMFPWVFMFTLGANFTELFDGKALPETFYKKHSRVLSKAGKYSLIIYMVHQPVIFAVIYVFEYLY